MPSTDYQMPVKGRRSPRLLPDALRNFDAMPDSAFVRADTVAMLYGCSIATVWRLTKQGKIPAPKKLSTRVTGWNVADLRKALSANRGA